MSSYMRSWNERARNISVLFSLMRMSLCEEASGRRDVSNVYDGSKYSRARNGPGKEAKKSNKGNQARDGRQHGVHVWSRRLSNVVVWDVCLANFVTEFAKGPTPSL